VHSGGIDGDVHGVIDEPPLGTVLLVVVDPGAVVVVVVVVVVESAGPSAGDAPEGVPNSDGAATHDTTMPTTSAADVPHRKRIGREVTERLPRQGGTNVARRGRR
jgi:hypothetical protein